MPDPMTAQQMLIIAVGALSSAVVFLFMHVMKKNAAQDKQIEECNAERKLHGQQIAAVVAQQAEIRQQANDRVESLQTELIKIVREVTAALVNSTAVIDKLERKP